MASTTSTVVKVGTAAAGAALAAGVSGMFGGVALAGGSQGGGGVSGGGSGLPLDMSRAVGGNSGETCGHGGIGVDGLGLNVLNINLLSDRGLKRDVTPVRWSRSA